MKAHFIMKMYSRSRSFTKITALMVVTCLIACSPKKEKVLPDVVSQIVLKKTIVNSKSIIQTGRLSAAGVLDRRQMRTMSMRSIDSAASPAENGFKYHLIDSLFADRDRKVVLLGREYPEENRVWVAYFEKGKLIDSRLVYEDNAEGFLTIESTIDSVYIITTTVDEFIENKKPVVDTIEISSDGHFARKHH